MPFGLTNTPSVFQRLMQQVLMGVHPGEGPSFVTAYIDDFLVFLTTLEEHLEHLRTVLQRLCEVGLKAETSKVPFCPKASGVLGTCPQPNPNLVRAVCEFPIPATVQGVMVVSSSLANVAKNSVRYATTSSHL